VDQTPYLETITTQSGQGKALLVCGLGMGGKGYFALDVSTPEQISSESDLAAAVMWEFPDNNTAQVDIDDMGFSFSRGFVVRSYSPAHPYVVIFGNGYNSTTGRAKLFILDAEFGHVIKKIDTLVGSPGVASANGLSTPALVDVNNDRIVDYAYAGDLKGNLWKFDLTSDDLAEWDVAYKNASSEPVPLFTAVDDNGAAQPITAKPDVMGHTDRNLSGNIVVFGTGKFLGLSDFSDTQTQTVYGIWDYGDDLDDGEYLGTFQRSAGDLLSNQPSQVTLLEQEEIYYGIPTGFTQYMRVISNYPINYAVEQDSDTGQQPNPSSSSLTAPNHAGWYLDLPIRKERMVRDLFIRGGKVIFITTIPESSACSAGGQSVLMEIDAVSGSRLTEAQFDINNDGVVNDADLISIEVPNPDYNPSDPDSKEFITISVASSGLWFPTMLYPPSIVGIEREEIKLMSTASGGIIDVREVAEKKGVIYWLQLSN
jgi:Tfp pilus tip-associated adhesin PilY1